MKNKYEVIFTQLVNTETGEVFDAKDVEDVHVSLVEKGGYARQPNQIEYYREQELRYKDKTPYVWANFEYNKPYFPEVDDPVIPRLIFFATFCNDLGFSMRRQDIKGTLKLNYNQAKKFRDSLTRHGIISIKENKSYVLSTAFYRGILQDNGKDFTRVFIEANQQLYMSCTTTQHKKLSYIYRMIPYVNRQTNILCYNQQEQDSKYIVNMTIKEFCKIVGYDSTHSTRLRKDLLKFRIYGELVVGFFDDMTELNPNGNYVVVNPKLFYGGEREKQAYADIRKLFEDEKDTSGVDCNSSTINTMPTPMGRNFRSHK